MRKIYAGPLPLKPVMASIRIFSSMKTLFPTESKTALAMLPATLINPGDVTLMTVPGYPVAGSHTKFLGGQVHPIPLRAEHDFLPDLESIPPDILARAKLLVLNYPNSPTGKTASRDFFEQVVDFAKANEIVVVQDAAHILLTFDGKPRSFLQTPGAIDVGVEVHSMSKGYDMIGWRMGFVCGNERIVSAFADVKDNSDSGQFMAIQKASALSWINYWTMPSNFPTKPVIRSLFLLEKTTVTS